MCPYFSDCLKSVPGKYIFVGSGDRHDKHAGSVLDGGGIIGKSLRGGPHVGGVVFES